MRGKGGKGAIILTNVQEYSKTFKNLQKLYTNIQKLHTNIQKLYGNIQKLIGNIQEFRMVNWLSG
jgi:hypothetical protein